MRKVLAEAVLDGGTDCDAALEHHLHDNYRGPLEVLSITDAHLALSCANMGWRDRVVDLDAGRMTVARAIEEFGLGPFLPLFDRREQARFRRGEVVRYEGRLCRVLGRRAVTPFALPRLDGWELFVETLDGKTAAFVGESEVGPNDDAEAITPTN